MKKLQPGLFIRLAAFLTGKTIVAIKDHEHKVYYTLAWINAFEEKECHVYWGTGVGHCILHDDGSVTGKSNYIEKWIKV